MTKAMQQSTKITGLMSSLVKVPELQQTTQQMAMQMEKAGLITEVRNLSIIYLLLLLLFVTIVCWCYFLFCSL